MKLSKNIKELSEAFISFKEQVMGHDSMVNQTELRQAFHNFLGALPKSAQDGGIDDLEDSFHLLIENQHIDLKSLLQHAKKYDEFIKLFAKSHKLHDTHPGNFVTNTTMLVKQSENKKKSIALFIKLLEHQKRLLLHADQILNSKTPDMFIKKI